MIYDFECGCGHRQEEILPMKHRNDFIRCNECGAQTTRVISCHIERVEPNWLNSMKHQLHPRDRAVVTDRHSFYKALDKRGLVAI